MVRFCLNLCLFLALPHDLVSHDGFIVRGFSLGCGLAEFLGSQDLLGITVVGLDIGAGSQWWFLLVSICGFC